MADFKRPGTLTRRHVLQVAGVGTLGAFGVGAAAARAERYIVGTRSRAAERAARSRADSVHRVLDFGDIGKAVAGRFSPQALDVLRNRADVRYVEVDGTMEAIAQTLPWGIDRVDAERVHADGETGGDDTDGEGGADIAIIDTGIDSDHPDLQANLGAGTAFVEARGPYSKTWDDDNGHGTHCAGIADAVDNGEGVVGVSTEATLHAVKVLDKNGSGSFSDVAAGIRWTADQGYDVGSLSLGASSGSQTVKDACTYAYNKGVLLVGAAGNAGPCSDCVGYPAAYSEVIAVSATNPDDSLADYSSTGPEVELAAPGTDIYSTYVGGGYETYSGTSMACPHVSGAAGQLLDNGYTNTEARDRLASTAEDIGLGSNESGNGLLDVEAAVGGSTDSAPSVSWVNPSDGEQVSGSVTVQISASDTEDADDSLTIEYAIDGGPARTATYNATSGYYEDSWDSTTVPDGDHTLEARATDSAGNTSTSTITVSTQNTDDAPSVSWVNPSGGETVSGSVPIELDASDDRDAGSDLTVEWQVDDGTWRTASYDSSSGTYTDSWDSTTVSDGDHALDARVTDTGGNTSAEERITVTVSNAASAPTIDSYTVTEAGSPNPHAEITADWAVSDANGDLDSVDLVVKDSSGSVVDSASHAVSGSSASGSDYFEIKHARGQSFDVTLTVTDSQSNAATATRTVTE